MGRSERIKVLEIRNLVVKKLGVVGGFSSEVVTSGAKPSESRNYEEECPMSAQRCHVIKEAIIGGDGSWVVGDRLCSRTGGAHLITRSAKRRKGPVKTEGSTREAGDPRSKMKSA